LGIGGINIENAQDVIASGADGIAMIRGVLNDKDIENTVKKYLSILGEN
jgi:thiamine monophosphate synthase